MESQWTPDEIDLLIQLVRDQQDLYDQSRPSYSNLNITEKCWRSIAEQLPTKNVKLCKAKWQILRGTYRAKKQYTHGASGSCAKPPVKWPYFHALSFLDKHLKDRKSYSNISVPQESANVIEHFVLSPETGLLEKETEEIMSIEVEEENCNEEQSSNAEQSKSKSSYTPRKKKLDSVETSFINYLEQKKSKSSIRLFLESLEEDMTKLSPRALYQFKRDVLRSLEEHLNENGNYN